MSIFIKRHGTMGRRCCNGWLGTGTRKAAFSGWMATGSWQAGRHCRRPHLIANRRHAPRPFFHITAAVIQPLTEVALEPDNVIFAASIPWSAVRNTVPSTRLRRPPAGYRWYCLQIRRTRSLRSAARDPVSRCRRTNHRLFAARVGRPGRPACRSRLAIFGRGERHAEVDIKAQLSLTNCHYL